MAEQRKAESEWSKETGYRKLTRSNEERKCAKLSSLGGLCFLLPSICILFYRLVAPITVTITVHV